MYVKGLGEIEAVAVDIDGTLYPQWRLTVRALFRYIAHGFFFLFYGFVRNEMHALPQHDNFRQVQAKKMAGWLRCSPEEAERRLNDIVYKGLEPYFERIACYSYVPETFRKLKEAGFKLALLSDFPPEQKGDVWGVRQYCNVVLGTEQLGALKPDPYSFLKMADELGVEPSRILYVGNSLKYDVRGSHNAGMKCAYLLPFWRRIFNKPLKEAEISFSNYRQLLNIVLE